MKNLALCAVALALVLVGCGGAAGSSKYAGVYEYGVLGTVAFRLTLNADGTCKTEVLSTDTTANCKYVVDGQTITLTTDTGTLKATFDSDGRCMTVTTSATTGDRLCKAGGAGGGSDGSTDGDPGGIDGVYSNPANPDAVFRLNTDGSCVLGVSKPTSACSYTVAGQAVMIRFSNAARPNGTLNATLKDGCLVESETGLSYCKEGFFPEGPDLGEIAGRYVYSSGDDDMKSYVLTLKSDGSCDFDPGDDTRSSPPCTYTVQESTTQGVIVSFSPGISPARFKDGCLEFNDGTLCK